jgi:glycosyltransferase involved in cell wall biosynthesis
MKIIRPTVSIIIPTYNRGQFIGAAVQSVLNQTFQDFEVFVVDDGSTDQTSEIVHAFSSEKVQYVFQPNRGRSNARNHALGLAQGRYIAFLDSDDLYLPDKLAYQVAYMDSHLEIGMIYTSAYCIDENGMRMQNEYKATVSGWVYKDIAFFVPVTITLPTVMARREVFEAVGGFDEAMERFEDTDMWRRISKQYQINALREQTCLLRTHTENILAAQNPQRISDALDYYVKKINDEDCDVGIITRRKGIARLYGYYGAAMMSKSAWGEMGYSLLLKGMLSWPLNLRNIARFIIYHKRKMTNT